MNTESVGLTWIGLGYFATGILSAVFPWVNSEVLVASMWAVTESQPLLIGLMVTATTGHMIGKSCIYWTSRGGSRVLPPRVARGVTRWSALLQAHPRKAGLLVLLASTVGVPPFYVVTLVFGTLRMPFVLYATAGSAGRLIRYTAVLALSRAVIPGV